MNQRNNFLPGTSPLSNNQSRGNQSIDSQGAKGPSRFISSLRFYLLAVLCAGGLVVMSATSSQARVDEDAIFEVSLGGGLAVPSGDFTNYWDTLGAKSGYELDISGGYFVTQNLSIGLAFEIAQFSIDNSVNPQNYRLYTAGLYGKYFTGLDSKISPYVRVQGGVTIPNFSAPLLTIPGEAFHESQFDPAFDALIGLGARLSTGETGGIFLEASYRYTRLAGRTSQFKNESLVLPGDVSHIQLTIGFGFDFGPKQ